MNRLERLVKLEKELQALSEIDNICVAMMYHRTPVRVLAWKSEDNHTIDTETNPITFELINGEVRTVSNGNKYLPSDIMSIRDTLANWFKDEV